MPIVIVGGEHDGMRYESVCFVPPRYVYHSIHIVSQDGQRRESFPVYTPPDIDLPEIFRILHRGYRQPTNNFQKPYNVIYKWHYHTRQCL